MFDARRARRPSALALPRRVMVMLLSSLLAISLAGPATAAVVGPGSTGASVPPLVETTTASTMAMDLYHWINRDRKAAGLRPLLWWNSLASLANDRSDAMAVTETLSHDAAGGDPGTALTSAGIQWYSYGEVIGMTSYAWGYQAAANLYSMWKHSAPHRAILFSSRSNYIGVGIARAADGSTWSSILLTESVDHTRPIAHLGSLSRSGTSIHITWSGADTRLQTHTAGIRGFYVQYRINGGAWHLLRKNTTTHSTTLYHALRHHYYAFRVRAADRRGNLSAWTAVKAIKVP